MSPSFTQPSHFCQDPQNPQDGPRGIWVLTLLLTALFWPTDPSGLVAPPRAFGPWDLFVAYSCIGFLEGPSRGLSPLHSVSSNEFSLRTLSLLQLPSHILTAWDWCVPVGFLSLNSMVSSRKQKPHPAWASEAGTW